ncbi:hypothetical protein Lser_V15G37346 [Lactuca serriola]
MVTTTPGQVLHAGSRSLRSIDGTKLYMQGQDLWEVVDETETILVQFGRWRHQIWCCLGVTQLANLSQAHVFFRKLEKRQKTFNHFQNKQHLSLFRLPWLKWLDVSYCRDLVELSELPLSIAAVIADGCDSLEIFGDVSNCEWLWKVTLTGNQLGPLAGDILLNSMLLQGNTKDYFISINISNIDIWSGCSVLWVDWVKTYNMLLPHDWYNHFSGILMFLKSNGNLYSLNPGIIIKLGVDEDFQSELGQESDETLETQSQEKTYVGYVSFSSLRHTTCLNSTYNMISFSQDKENLYGDDYKFREFLTK